MTYKEFKQKVKQTEGRSLYEFHLYLVKHYPGKHFKECNTPEAQESYLRDGYEYPSAITRKRK